MYTRCLSKIFSGSFILCFLLTAIAVLGTAQPAHAAVPTTFYVKAGASGSCSSWSDACDLQAALNAAAYGDQIWVAAGITYSRSSLPSKVM